MHKRIIEQAKAAHYPYTRLLDAFKEAGSVDKTGLECFIKTGERKNHRMSRTCFPSGRVKDQTWGLIQMNVLILF